MIDTPFSRKEDLFLPMDVQKLRKTVSDVTNEIDKLGKAFEANATVDEVKQVECECCGLKEDCTPYYITKVKDTYSGNWVCGLCSEAVKERLKQAPKAAVEEALSTHKVFCQDFNSTTRLNPKLSLTLSMRTLAKRSHEKRNSNTSSASKIARTSSCIPRINLD